ncbi:hypothetical protein QE152_g19546 [Popillia japonica]|uniref:Uncharacterized protein n=1 Tax=Popillia japonica TaxID=7064 RepID=A0AAW1KST0_POPJA
MEEIKEIFKAMIEDLRTDLRDMRKEQRDFYDEVKSLRLENQELKKQIIVLQNKIEVIEKNDRKKGKTEQHNSIWSFNKRKRTRTNKADNRV